MHLRLALNYMHLLIAILWPVSLTLISLIFAYHFMNECIARECKIIPPFYAKVCFSEALRGNIESTSYCERPRMRLICPLEDRYSLLSFLAKSSF